jgi:flagellar assembly protein FliH
VPPPSNTLGASPHARFIPREELTNYTNWTPGALGPARSLPSTPPSGIPLQEDVRRSGDQRNTTEPSFKGNATATLPSPADTLSAVPTQDDLEALQHAARQAGYHDGYRDGLAALDSFKRSFAQQMSSQLGQLMNAVDREFLSLESDMAQALVQAATGLARQIIRSELATQPELVTQVARQAVAALSQSVRRVEMRLHPDDLALVQAGLGEEAVSRGVTCIPDPTVARGGCFLQTELGSVDARIEHQWDQALRRLGQDATQWPLKSEDQF